MAQSLEEVFSELQRDASDETGIVEACQELLNAIQLQNQSNETGNANENAILDATNQLNRALDGIKTKLPTNLSTTQPLPYSLLRFLCRSYFSLQLDSPSRSLLSSMFDDLASQLGNDAAWTAQSESFTLLGNNLMDFRSRDLIPSEVDGLESLFHDIMKWDIAINVLKGQIPQTFRLFLVCLRWTLLRLPAKSLENWKKSTQGYYSNEPPNLLDSKTAKELLSGILKGGAAAFMLPESMTEALTNNTDEYDVLEMIDLLEHTKDGLKEMKGEEELVGIVGQLKEKLGNLGGTHIAFREQRSGS